MTHADPAGSCTLSVVSHGQGPLIARLLADLAACERSPIAEIVITRNLRGESIEFPARMPFPVRIVDNASPRGFGANHDAAFAGCTTPWFAVLNPDLRVARDPFGPLLAAARADAALLCPRVLEADGRDADCARLLPTPARLLRRAARRLLPSFAAGSVTDASADGHAGESAEWFAGMFMLLRSEALRAVGGFDERYFMYCEDVDLCARLRLAGWRLQRVDSVSVVHDAQRASRRSARHLRWHLASLARLWGSAAFWRYRALLAAERRAGPAQRLAGN